MITSTKGQNISDTGAAVWFVRKGKLCVVACDRFRTVATNLHAIALIIEGRRREARYGTDWAQEATWSVFEYPALPQVAGDAIGSRPWRDVLGLNGEATAEVAEAAFKALARTHHPDVGGDAPKMAELNEAIRQAREEFGGAA
jgi:hypothetical protein